MVLLLCCHMVNVLCRCAVWTLLCFMWSHLLWPAVFTCALGAETPVVAMTSTAAIAFKSDCDMFVTGKHIAGDRE